VTMTIENDVARRLRSCGLRGCARSDISVNHDDGPTLKLYLSPSRVLLSDFDVIIVPVNADQRSVSLEPLRDFQLSEVSEVKYQIGAAQLF
jgi:hypothetical protein